MAKVIILNFMYNNLLCITVELQTTASGFNIIKGQVYNIIYYYHVLMFMCVSNKNLTLYITEIISMKFNTTVDIIILL